MLDLQPVHHVPLIQPSLNYRILRISRLNIELSRSTSLTSRRRYHSLPSKWTFQPIGIEPTSAPLLSTNPKPLLPFPRTFNSGPRRPLEKTGSKDTTQREKEG